MPTKSTRAKKHGVSRGLETEDKICRFLEICDVSFKVQGERTDMIIPPHDLNALKALKAVYNEEKA